MSIISMILMLCYSVQSVCLTEHNFWSRCSLNTAANCYFPLPAKNK